MNLVPATPNDSPDKKSSSDRSSRTHSNALRDYAVSVVRTLTSRDYIAYFAGGCVRDEIMGSTPSDFDVATNATPEQVQQIFGRNRSVMIGAAFGVVCVHERKAGISHQVEVATFRSDGAYIDGRRPESVAYTSPELDAQRRDFTINGIFYDPLSEEFIDFVSGWQDIQARTIRAIGDPFQRFAEDRLRLLRAVRFAARFEFQIEPSTFQAIREMANRIVEVSPERIAAEVRKMLSDRRGRVQSLLILDETGLLHITLPEAFDALNQDVDARARALQRLDALHSSSWIVATVVLLWEELESGRIDSNSFASSIKNRWHLSNDEEQEIRFVVRAQQWLLQANSSPWSRLQPLLLSPHIDSALSLTEALLSSSAPHSSSTLLRHSLRATSNQADVDVQALSRLREILKQDIAVWNPRPIVDGSLLMELGLPVGPRYTQLIGLGRDAQLDGRIQNRDDAREWIRQQIDSST